MAYAKLRYLNYTIHQISSILGDTNAVYSSKIDSSLS